MKKTLALGAALALLVSSAASAQALGEGRPWQFQSANDKIANANTLLLQQQKEGGLLTKDSFFGVGGGAGGVGGTSNGAWGTSQAGVNFYSFVSTTSNTCEAAAGATVNCGGANNAGATSAQTSTSSSATSGTSLDGNTVSPHGNTTTATVNQTTTVQK